MLEIDNLTEFSDQIEEGPLGEFVRSDGWDKISQWMSKGVWGEMTDLHEAGIDNLPPNFDRSVFGQQPQQQGILGNINQFMMNPSTALAIGLLFLITFLDIKTHALGSVFVTV